MELFRALGSLAEPPTEAARPVAAALGLGPPPSPAEHHELFDRQLPPYASVYLGPEGMLGGEARDRVAGFWRALALQPPDEPDHLTTVLAFYARIRELEDTAVDRNAASSWRRAREAFFWEHVVSWLPMYLDHAVTLGSPFYAGWAGLVAEALRDEASSLPEPAILPLHLREAPGPADPRSEGLDSFVRSMLSPVRCGMILTRSDFGRAAHGLGLGRKVVERPVLMRGLLGHDRAATLSWLAAEARGWRERHECWAEITPSLAGYWSARAASSCALLGEALADAR